MKQNHSYHYLLYIGTTKVAFVKADYTSQTPEVLAYCTKLAHGFERGIVKDLAQASETLRQMVREVVDEKEETIVPCRLVFSNSYLKSYTYQSSLYFPSNPHAITLRDVKQAIAQTRSVATIPLEEVIVQAIPQEFLVNDLPGIRNPLGLEASRLGVTLRLLAMNYLVYSNLQKVLERAQLECSEMIPSVLAASEAALRSSEKQEGVIFVLIGGSTTHFACYKADVLIGIHSIPTGADTITEMIAQKLNMNHLDAQRTKEVYGTAQKKSEFSDELIPIPAADGKKKYHIQRSEFETHMTEGLQLFMDRLVAEIRALQKQFAPIDQVVLTGGGAELEGFIEVIKEKVSPMARIGICEGCTGPAQFVKKPASAACLGGFFFSHQIKEPSPVVQTPQNWMAKTANTVREWIFENF